jgi:hypothetical protein
MQVIKVGDPDCHRSRGGWNVNNPKNKGKIICHVPTFESLKSGEIDSNGISNNKINYLNFLSATSIWNPEVVSVMWLSAVPVRKSLAVGSHTSPEARNVIRIAVTGLLS